MIDHFKQKLESDFTHFYVKYILANYSMPTLLKTKPSCLISINKKYVENQLDFFRLFQEEINQFHSEYRVIYQDETMFLVLVYHKGLLYKTLLQEEHRKILNEYGYDFHINIVENSVKLLRKHYWAYKVKGEEFPHEIGILLGYPIEDVKAFIKNNGKNYKFCGLWKVYNDVEKAMEVFEYYRMMKEEAIYFILSGNELIDVKEYIDNRNYIK